MRVTCSVMHKHAMELRKMADAEHVHLVPLIEAALAIMRLSCEKVDCCPSAVNVITIDLWQYISAISRTFGPCIACLTTV
jgi:hypothetical protein